MQKFALRALWIRGRFALGFYTKFTRVLLSGYDVTAAAAAAQMANGGGEVLYDCYGYRGEEKRRKKHDSLE